VVDQIGDQWDCNRHAESDSRFDFCPGSLGNDREFKNTCETLGVLRSATKRVSVGRGESVEC
jgi:hypothetical protein